MPAMTLLLNVERHSPRAAAQAGRLHRSAANTTREERAHMRRAFRCTSPRSTPLPSLYPSCAARPSPLPTPRQPTAPPADRPPIAAPLPSAPGRLSPPLPCSGCHHRRRAARARQGALRGRRGAPQHTQHGTMSSNITVVGGSSGKEMFNLTIPIPGDPTCRASEATPSLRSRPAPAKVLQARPKPGGFHPPSSTAVSLPGCPGCPTCRQALGQHRVREEADNEVHQQAAEPQRRGGRGRRR
jgi:hypothetical protein